jgi:hypothetical protein
MHSYDTHLMWKYYREICRHALKDKHMIKFGE